MGSVSIKVASRVWDLATHRRGTELLTLLALADFSDDNGESYPSLAQLAKKVRLTVRQLCHILHSLEADGDIRRMRSTGGRNRRTRYIVLAPTNCEAGNSVTGNTVTDNSVAHSNKTVLPTSHALNSHKPSIVARRKKRDGADPDPRVKTLITAFVDKYDAAVGSRPVITGKDAASLKRLLTAGHDVPAIDAAMDGYFANKFYSQTGFDAAGFAKAFNRLNSAGAKKRHNYEDGAFPDL